MTPPRRFLIRMTLFLAVVAGVVGVLAPAMLPFFLANPLLNGFIFAELLIGIILNIRQVATLNPEVRWIEHFRRDEAAVTSADLSPRLLAPMATMLREHKGRGRFSLSAPAMRSMLDGIASRLDESREIARYFIGLSIFLGLLGTFWGLMETVGSISAVLSTLDLGASGNQSALFADLKRGLERPLAGMGTAFSSSLFGLAGSLILGFLDLQAGRAQNAFFNDLEEWLSGVTRLGGGYAGGDGDQPVPAYIQALLEQTAESIEDLQRTLARGEESRVTALSYQRDLIDRLGTLTDQMRAEQQVLLKMAEGQVELKAIIARLGEVMSRAPGGVDDSSRTHFRNMDLALARLVDEATRGREEAVRDIRSEIKLLARTIAATTPGGPSQPDRI